MRRLIAAAAAVVLISTTAACNSDDDTAPTAGASAAPTTAAPDLSAATAEACAEAVPLGETTAAAFMPDINKMMEAAIAGDEAKGKAAEKVLRDKLKAWSDKLTELAAQPIEEPVKAAMTETAALVVKLNDPDDKTPVNDVNKQLTEAAAKVKTACA